MECAVCHKGKGPEKCEVCGFSDNGVIYRTFPIPEDTQNWLDTVVKPYRAQWEARLAAQVEDRPRPKRTLRITREVKQELERNELLTQFDALKKRETHLLAKIKALTSNAPFTDHRDGKVYKTVRIGNQIWMAENLNYALADIKCYNNTKYGGLYDWETAKKICPAGWHLPNNDEWQILIDFVGGKEIAGKELKSRNGWNKDGNGEDIYGFCALPGGCVYFGGDFDYVGDFGYWWSSSADVNRYAYYRAFTATTITCTTYSADKFYLYSVRCVKD